MVAAQHVCRGRGVGIRGLPDGLLGLGYTSGYTAGSRMAQAKALSAAALYSSPMWPV